MNKEYFDDNFLSMKQMMQYLITNIEDMKQEIQALKQENTELKLNMIAISPMYSNEQKSMAVDQLRNIKEHCENSLASTFK